MLPLSLDCPFLIAPTVLSGVYQSRDNGKINKRKKKLLGQSRMDNPETMAT
jgi:hypothetical protein